MRGPIDSTPAIAADRQLIQGYNPGGFTISGVRHMGSVIVFPDRTLAWQAARLEDVTAASLGSVGEADPRPELLLIGLGDRFLPLPAARRDEIRTLGAAVDVMSTPAACRTYNVLLAEGRRVAAALIAMPGAG